MKLWQGRFEEDQDPVFEKMNRSLPVDAVLLEVDVRASRAHARGLLGAGILDQEEWKAIDGGLESILSQYSPDEVKAMPYEDITPLSKPPGEKVGPLRSSFIPAGENDQVARIPAIHPKSNRAGLADLEALELAFVENASRN
jgi:argininosuccinate lyase